MSANELYKELKAIDSQVMNLKSQRTAVLAKFKVELVAILKYRSQLLKIWSMMRTFLKTSLMTN